MKVRYFSKRCRQKSHNDTFIEEREPSLSPMITYKPIIPPKIALPNSTNVQSYLI